MTRDEKEKDIREHPERHHHNDMGALHACCYVGGALDLGLIEDHQHFAPVGNNGGQACDVFEGPCSCGAWH